MKNEKRYNELMTEAIGILKSEQLVEVASYIGKDYVVVKYSNEKDREFNIKGLIKLLEYGDE